MTAVCSTPVRILIGPSLQAITVRLISIRKVTEDAYHNISCQPDFAYFDDPNGLYNFHIAYDSPCAGAGDNDVVDVNDMDMDNEPRIYGAYVDIGADEAYSCDDDLSEDDIYHPMDWYGADGVINLHEYYEFAKAWQTYDPNHPLCDPNDPGYVSSPNDPNYISASDNNRSRLQMRPG